MPGMRSLPIEWVSEMLWTQAIWILTNRPVFFRLFTLDCKYVRLLVAEGNWLAWLEVTHSASDTGKWRDHVQNSQRGTANALLN